MKKFLKIFLLVLILSGCNNLKYNSENNFSIIETQIKEGNIIIKDKKIFYKNEYDVIMHGENELKLLEEYANQKGLIVAPIK